MCYTYIGTIWFVGNFFGAIYSFPITDTTERKQTEEQLRLLSSAVEQSTEGIAVSDLKGNLVFVNNAFATVYGYTSKELVGKHLSIFHTPEQMPSVEAANQQIQETGEFSGEIWHIRRDGTVFPGLMHNSLLRDNEGNPVGMIGTLRDITARKQAEEQIEAALKEKEVLLQEIHHRVKNNLQIISSLLDMSSLRTHDQQAISLLTDARSRIHIMALIHSQLYQSKRFDQIDMQSHIRELVGYLSAAYAARKRITPVVEVSGVCLSLTQAIPCALVLNELISNAFKHAFTEEQEGTLEITMRQSPEGPIVLRIKDNGVGIRDDIDMYHTNTLGLKLVRRLVQKQLRGEIQVNRDTGTEFIIIFKTLSFRKKVFA